jgi:hypothetical protein
MAGSPAMTGALYIFFPIVGVLLLLLGWALRAPGKGSRDKFDLASLEQSGRRHATYFALIRQASSPADMEFLARRGSPGIAARVRRQRRQVLILYLAQLRDDFQRLLRLARAVAALSPAVGSRQEFERLWLSLEFSWRYHMIRIGIRYGLLPIPQLNTLSQMVSQLAVQMETSMKEIGERAALAVQIASSLDGNGVDVA